MSKTIDDRIIEIDHIVRGVDGNNGLRGRVHVVESSLLQMKDEVGKIKYHVYILAAVVVGGPKILDAIVGVVQ